MLTHNYMYKDMHVKFENWGRDLCVCVELFLDLRYLWKI